MSIGLLLLLNGYASERQENDHKLSHKAHDFAQRSVGLQQKNEPPRVYRRVSCCRFRGHEDKIVTKESEIGNETEVYERVQV